MSWLDPDLCDPSASDSCSFPAPHARWPYQLGALAGLILGTSALLFLFATAAPGDRGGTAGLLGIYGVALGGALLGIAWLGVLRQGLGGVAAAVGSFALPLVLAAVLLQSKHDRQATFVLVPAALAAFGWGHIVGPGHIVLRMIAGLTTVLWSLLFIGAMRDWTFPPLVGSFACSGIMLTGFGLALSFPYLHRARTW